MGLRRGEQQGRRLIQVHRCRRGRECKSRMFALCNVFGSKGREGDVEGCCGGA